jgi:hypothetical protein
LHENQGAFYSVSWDTPLRIANLSIIFTSTDANMLIHKPWKMLFT